MCPGLTVVDGVPTSQHPESPGLASPWVGDSEPAVHVNSPVHVLSDNQDTGLWSV
jgi:hypothetical protein